MYYQLNLEHVPENHIAEAVEAIPNTITELDLSHNNLHQCRSTSLANALAVMPCNVTRINLSNNHLGTKSYQELAIIFDAIPTSITHVNLSDNQLGYGSGKALSKAIAKLPSSIISINLSGNSFGDISFTQPFWVFSKLPSNITSLNLSSNFLGNHKEITSTTFEALPKSIQTLDLRNNMLGHKTCKALAAIFAELPSSITCINLSDNGLIFKSLSELATIFSALPKQVHTLELDDAIIDTKTTDEQAHFLVNLPSNITTLQLQNRRIHPETYLLDLIFPTESRNHYHEEICIENPITPHIHIDEKQLVMLIDYYQKRPLPIHDLVCALLLDGRIANTFHEHSKNIQQYPINRILLAIDFYRKAACDPELKIKVEHILWFMRTCLGQDSAAIHQKLKPFKLSPDIDVYRFYQQDKREHILELEHHSDKPIDIRSIGLDKHLIYNKLVLTSLFANSAMMELNSAVHSCLRTIYSLISSINDHHSRLAMGIGLFILLAYSLPLTVNEPQLKQVLP